MILGIQNQMEIRGMARMTIRMDGIIGTAKAVCGKMKGIRKVAVPKETDEEKGKRKPN